MSNKTVSRSCLTCFLAQWRTPDAPTGRCGSLLTALRNAQDELQRYRVEDSDLMRAIFAQSADHAERLRRAEEDGYAKALRDIEAGKIEPDHAARIVAALTSIVRVT